MKVIQISRPSHTPTPWEEKKYDIINRAERAGYEFSVAQEAIESEEQKRLNAHDELVAALRQMVAFAEETIGVPFNECIGFDLTRAALAKVAA